MKWLSSLIFVYSVVEDNDNGYNDNNNNNDDDDNNKDKWQTQEGELLPQWSAL